MQNIQTKLKELWGKIKDFFKKLNKKTLILLVVCLTVILAAAGYGLVKMNQKNYAVLYTGLNSTETSTVLAYLGERGVTDYQVRGDSVLVPEGREDQLRADLAMSGYLTTGFNYEYLDRLGATATDSERREAMRIATVQKLEATIRLFEGVRDAQVDIALGTKQVYILEDRPASATASVTITPEGNQRLSDGVVKAIRHTVSHSVEQLDISNVSIVDTNGNTYSDSDTISMSSEATALKLQHEEQINNNVRTQILETLGPIYGRDNIHVGVMSTVEVSRKVRDSTYYSQPDGSVVGGGLVINDKVFVEKIQSEGEAVGGAVGTTTNADIPLQPDLNPTLGEGDQYSGSSIERGQVVDTTNEQEEVLEGRLSDLRVTVSVNQDCANAGSMTIEALRDHVATISGIGTNDPQSRVHIIIAPFDRAADVTPPGGIFSSENSWILYAAIGGLVLFLILLVIIILLARSRKKKRLAQQRAMEEEMMAAEAAAQAAAIIAAAPPTGGADIMEVNTEKSMELRKTVRQFAQNNPEIAAQMVKAWLKGDESGA